MRFSSAVIALAALASSVVAQTADFDGITSPTKDQEIPAGSSFDIKWEPGSNNGKVSISLLQGDTPTTLQPGPVVVSSIDNSVGKHTWTVPASQFKTYGFKISLDSDPSTFQYSNPFHIKGGSAVESGSKNTTATAAPTGKNTTSSTKTKTKTKATITPSLISNSTRNATTTSAASSAATLAPVPTSNVTVLTTLTPSQTPAPAGPSSTAVAAPAPTKNSASNLVAGGITLIGGFVLAFAL